MAPCNAALVSLVTFSALLLVSSVSFLTVFLALEMQTFSLLILVTSKRGSSFSTEAGLKFFVLGAVSSGVLLLGCSLFYGFSGEAALQGLGHSAGSLLITVSLLFKLSVAPFHF